MKLKAVLFDLDGTLLPLDQDEFVRIYFNLLTESLTKRGFDAKKVTMGVQAGILAMVQNDGSNINEVLFWDAFAKVCGEDLLMQKDQINEFYTTEFYQLKEACGYNEAAKEVVDFLKAREKKVVLATNPLFPSIATETRMGWAGFVPEDFELYTVYENSSFSKPNLKYYQEILGKIDCMPEECLMVGNDVGEDMIAQQLGMKVFLLSDCIVNRKKENISEYSQGGFEELKKYLIELEEKDVL